MSCRDHAMPIEGCMGCAGGRWDRAEAEQLIEGGYATGITAAAIRVAIAEVERLQLAADRIVTIAAEAFGLGPIEPIDATMSRIERGIFEQHKRISELERELEALRCHDLDSFEDGSLSPERRAAFQRHLTTCAQCVEELQASMVVEAIADSPPREPQGGYRG